MLVSANYYAKNCKLQTMYSKLGKLSSGIVCSLGTFRVSSLLLLDGVEKCVNMKTLLGSK